MQLTQKFKKTLLAGALILSASNSFTASAETFTVSASGIPDVIAAPVPGFTTLGFGATINGDIIGGTCKVIGLSAISDADMKNDFNLDGTEDVAGSVDFGSIQQGATAACTTDASGASGSAMIIEIQGVAGSAMSISIPDVTGAGFTYRPSDESCIVMYGGNNTADLCAELSSGAATGVIVSTGNAAEGNGTSTDYDADILGKVRMILAGEITIDEPGIAQGTAVAEDIVVTILYE